MCRRHNVQLSIDWQKRVLIWHRVLGVYDLEAESSLDHIFSEWKKYLIWLYEYDLTLSTTTFQFNSFLDVCCHLWSNCQCVSAHNKFAVHWLRLPEKKMTLLLIIFVVYAACLQWLNPTEEIFCFTGFTL